MAQKKSLWSQLQRELERRERAAQARARAEQQMIRQLTRDQEHAERRAARADAAERKRQEQLAHEAGAAAARAMKARLDSRVADLKTLLTSVLQTPPQVPFAALKRTVQAPPFSPGGLGEASPAPRWEDFAPPPPGLLSGLLGGKARHARAMEEAQEACQQALAEHQRAEKQRASHLRSARQAHAQLIKTLEAEVRGHNAAVDQLERNFGPPRVSRMIVVWQVADTLRAELALDALEMAIWSRGDRIDDNFVHHSDRGVRRCSRGAE